MSRLALICGNGALPAALVAALPDRPMICALDGFAPEGLAVDQVFRIERLALFIRHLQDAGVTEVAFAGAVARPRLDPALFDPQTALIVPRLLAAIHAGDDAGLRVILGLFEEEGLTVRGVADLAPDLLAGVGVLGAVAPKPQDETDATRGRAILSALAPVDVGQACVVAAALCLGVEAIYGTDALLADVASHRPLRHPAKGGVFVKCAKAGQDLRVDLPTIGPDTIDRCVAAGLSGICLQAGHVIVLDRAAVVARADAVGLALWALA